jgi:RNA polymerase sigma-70 factor (ECF subfamily)
MFAHLSEYLDRELDEVDCRQIEAHLAHCAACQACVETLARTVALCREMPDRDIPKDMATRLRAAIEKLKAEAEASNGAIP